MAGTGMPSPKVVTTLANRGKQIDAAVEEAVTSKKSPNAANEKMSAAGEVDGDFSDAPITSEKAAAGLARAKANEAALVKAAGAPKPPGVLDKLKSLVGVK